ncbi:hypothetical protein ERJ75_001114200 [Trypanosoma vivax]|nr:hypothetical protein ERJ75_001114200 [Trypanosoma vivax]
MTVAPERTQRVATRDVACWKKRRGGRRDSTGLHVVDKAGGKEGWKGPQARTDTLSHGQAACKLTRAHDSRGKWGTREGDGRRSVLCIEQEKKWGNSESRAQEGGEQERGFIEPRRPAQLLGLGGVRRKGCASTGKFDGGSKGVTNDNEKGSSGRVKLGEPEGQRGPQGHATATCIRRKYGGKGLQEAAGKRGVVAAR